MAVREGLLALLQHAPRYGYQLKTEFEATTGGVWQLNVGQVYTTLDRLERDGFVSMEFGADEQKRYTITADGRDELGAWWAVVPTAEPPPRDELMLKVLFAIEQGTDHALAVITRQRTALLELLHHHKRDRRSMVTPNASKSTEMANALVTDALIVRAEADLRWLDLCEARVLAARSVPERDTASNDTARTGTGPTGGGPTDSRPTDSRPTGTGPVDTGSTGTRPTGTGPTDTGPVGTSERRTP